MKQIFSIASLCLISHLAFAKTPDAYLTPYAGSFDILRNQKKFVGGAELRINNLNKYFVPRIGGFITSQSSHYIYGGFNIELPVVENSFYVIPGFAVGHYGHNKGKNLGGPLEFYTTIELNYQMPNMHRVGLTFGHISNAGIYKNNPGAENLLLNYSIPISY